MVRGGSWANTIDNARCAVRNRNHPDNNINDNNGFRVVVVAAHVSLPLLLVCSLVYTRLSLVLARALGSSNADRWRVRVTRCLSAEAKGEEQRQTGLVRSQFENP